MIRWLHSFWWSILWPSFLRSEIRLWTMQNRPSGFPAAASSGMEIHFPARDLSRARMRSHCDAPDLRDLNSAWITSPSKSPLRQSTRRLGQKWWLGMGLGSFQQSFQCWDAILSVAIFRDNFSKFQAGGFHFWKRDPTASYLEFFAKSRFLEYPLTVRYSRHAVLHTKDLMMPASAQRSNIFATSLSTSNETMVRVFFLIAVRFLLGVVLIITPRLYYRHYN